MDDAAYATMRENDDNKPNSEPTIAPRGIPDAPASPWRTRDARSVYRNPWIAVTEYQVVRPDGSEGIYGVVDPGDNVSIVALDHDDRIALVGQFMYPLQAYDWAVPSGKVEDGEAPLAAARRELGEEAGLEAGSWTVLGEYYLSPGISTQISHVYLAQDLHTTNLKPESTERLDLRMEPLQQAVRECLTGGIRNAPSVLGILRIWLTRQERAAHSLAHPAGTGDQ